MGGKLIFAGRDRGRTRFVQFAVVRRYFMENSRTVAVAYTFPVRRNGRTRLGHGSDGERGRPVSGARPAIGHRFHIRAEFSDVAPGEIRRFISAARPDLPSVAVEI